MYTPLFDYERDRLIMETPFVFRGEPYLYFPEGVEYFSLYRGTRKINTIQEVEYIAEKLYWLNREIDYSIFLYHMKQVTDRSNGHIVRTYSEDRIEKVCEFVWHKNKKPYCRRKRKVIFNPAKMISPEEKRSIINKLIHPKITFTPTDIWRACVGIDGKITIAKLAEMFDVSPPTMKNSMNKNMMTMIKLKNMEIKSKKNKEICKKAIKQIKDEGKKLTVRELKKRVSVRDYKLIKTLIEEAG